MSDTPRTDKLYEEVWRFTNETDAVDALISMRDLCRELERENAALREQVVIRDAAQGKDERAEPYSAIAQRHGFAPVPGGVRDRALRQFGQGGTPA